MGFGIRSTEKNPIALRNHLIFTICNLPFDIGENLRSDYFKLQMTNSNAKLHMYCMTI